MIRNKKKIIEKLRDDEHYYGDLGKKFLSNSNIKKLAEDPLNLYEDIKQTPPLIMGRYFHHRILEPEKAKKYEIVEVKSRNTLVYKDLLFDSPDDMLLLKHESEIIDDCVKVLEDNEVVDFFVKQGDVEYEVPNLVELGGEVWKCKADVLNHSEKLIIDLKTTSNILNFKKSADIYNYDSQAYIYSEAFGYEFLFIVIDKTTKQVGIFDCSKEFIERGRQKVLKAVDDFRRFYKDPEFDQKNFFISDTL